MKIIEHFGKTCMSQQAGRELYSLIIKEIKAGGSIELNFEGVVVYASPFFNIAFGKLLSQYSIEQVKNKVKIFDGMISRLIGTILMRTNYQPQSLAEDWITKAIDIDEKRELRWQLAKDYAAYSDFFKENENIVKAKENMVKAIDIFKACGAYCWGEKYEKELTAL